MLINITFYYEFVKIHISVLMIEGGRRERWSVYVWWVVNLTS